MFLFVNQHYLVINLENNNTDNVIIGSIGLGFLILEYGLLSNLLARAVFITVLLQKKLENLMILFLEIILINFLISAYISILCSSIIFLLVSNTQFLFLFDHQIYMHKNLVSLIILMSLSVCLDTILAIPISIKKKNLWLLL